jgi:hypothetical protein
MDARSFRGSAIFGGNRKQPAKAGSRMSRRFSAYRLIYLNPVKFQNKKNAEGMAANRVSIPFGWKYGKRECRFRMRIAALRMVRRRLSATFKTLFEYYIFLDPEPPPVNATPRPARKSAGEMIYSGVIRVLSACIRGLPGFPSSSNEIGRFKEF